MKSFGHVEIVSTRNWEDFVSKLRTVTLVGDPDLTPYRDAEISSRVVPIDEVYPISLYTLRKQLAIQKLLHRTFLREYDRDIFDLNHDTPDMYFRVSGAEAVWQMVPPIVEVSAADGGKTLLLDGEHRFMYARSIGLKVVRVVHIERVPSRYPIIATPVSWDEVRVFDDVPEVGKKRRFRFPTLGEFPDISTFSQVPITEENFRYFFYRDLEPVSSSGIRPSRHA